MMIRIARNLAALGFGALVAAFLVGPPTVRAQTTAIAITSNAIPLNRDDPAQQDIGHLRYLGGVAIGSPDRRFGGISALQWDAACNRLLATSDTGAWVVLTPVHADGRLVGVAPEAHIATIRDAAGQPPVSKAMADAEALSVTPEGDTLVWFERQNHAQRYRRASACDPESLNEPAHAMIASPDMARWPLNGGPEAAARFFDKQLVFAEDAMTKTGGHQGFIVSQTGKTLAALSLDLPEGYKPTGLALLDEASDGTSARYLLITRQFSPVRGVSARLMLLTVPASGGTITPSELAHLRRPATVDNMEAVTIRRDGAQTIVYLMSDDNFNALQRTILLAFSWQPDR